MVTKEQEERANRKIALSYVKMGFDIPLYYVEAFNDVTLAYCAENLFLLGSDEGEPVFLSDEQFQFVFNRKEVHLVGQTISKVKKAFTALGFIKKVEGGYEFDPMKLHEYIITKIS